MSNFGRRSMCRRRCRRSAQYVCEANAQSKSLLFQRVSNRNNALLSQSVQDRVVRYGCVAVYSQECLQYKTNKKKIINF